METESGREESENQDLILEQNRDSEINNPETEPTKMGVNDNYFKTPDLEAKGGEISDPKISIKEKMMKDFALVSEDSSEISESEDDSVKDSPSKEPEKDKSLDDSEMERSHDESELEKSHNEPEMETIISNQSESNPNPESPEPLNSQESEEDISSSFSDDKLVPSDLAETQGSHKKSPEKPSSPENPDLEETLSSENPPAPVLQEKDVSSTNPSENVSVLNTSTDLELETSEEPALKGNQEKIIESMSKPDELMEIDEPIAKERESYAKEKNVGKVVKKSSKSTKREKPEPIKPKKSSKKKEEFILSPNLFMKKRDKKGKEKDPEAEEEHEEDISLEEQRKDESASVKKVEKLRISGLNSPGPVKLRIKIGKDRTGEVVEPDLPIEDEQGFHGFPDSEIPDFVYNNYDDVDLKSAFRFKPTIFVSISSKKQGPAAKKPLPGLQAVQPGSVSTPKTSKVRFEDEISSSNVSTPISSVNTSLRTPHTSAKKKSGVAKYFDPLFDGWVREVVYRTNHLDTNNKSRADVYYHSPTISGQQKFKFRSANELEGHLITTGSMYPLTFFTFRKEPLGAPEGLEIVRYDSSKNETVSSPSHHDSIQSLGKRVSKPPDKLMETPEPSDSTRTSKRVSKPPEKLDPEPISKPKKLETESPSGSKPTKKLESLLKLNKVDNSGLWKDPENIVQSPKKTVSAGKVGGLLKVKMFSMLNAKNELNTDDNIACVSDDDIGTDPLSIDEKTPTPSTITLTKLPKVMPTAPVRNQPRPYSHVPIMPAPTPTLSITPISMSNLYPNLQAAPSDPSMNVTPTRPTFPKVFRPTKKTMLPCSIHCPGVSEFPSLSCTSCHCLFHPKCVGLPPTFCNNQAQFDFFCNDCQPEAPDISSPPVSHPTSTSTPVRSLQARPVNQLKPTSPPFKARTSLPENITIKKKAKISHPRPIECQTMVNIGGKKFLVIPRTNLELDSPPPSPPHQTSDKTESSRKSDKLPVLLEPADHEGGNAPRFELEQSTDGRLILKPVGIVDTQKIFGVKRLKRSGDSMERGSTKRLKPLDFHNTLSNGYFALLHVFKYLKVEERLTAAKVCKLWNELVFHKSLWSTISLKNIKVFNWAQLGDFITRISCRSLDMRKMVFVKDRDSTWAEIVTVSTKFFTLRHLQLPRIPGSVLVELISNCPHLEELNSPLTVSPVELQVLEKVSSLKELRVKTGTGSLKLENGLSALGNLSQNLTHLSLLTLSGLVDCDYDTIGTLTNLEQIELGDCSEAPVTIFKTLSDLLKLQRIRLEKGSVGDNISKLQKGDNLRQLELIDFHIRPGFKTGLKGLDNVRKFLIIPTYKDEVARSNTEIIDGVTKELKHLEAFYLGVTNEWLEAMVMAMGENQMKKAPGERECFPIEKGSKIEYISLPGLYRRICREMPNSKVKVLKMSAGATCKQFIRSLDK